MGRMSFTQELKALAQQAGEGMDAAAGSEESCGSRIVST
jgi:hypothetical protein